jgi:FkbM family methyltransferase
MDKWMDKCLRHLLEKEFSPQVVLDIGAADGLWSIGVSRLFKDAEFFMIDPLIESKTKFQLRFKNNQRYSYILMAVGEDCGEQLMNVTPDLDGSSLLRYYGGEDSAQQRHVPVTTVDRLLLEGKIKPPHLVKIDVQGFEVKVLRGGQKMFESAEVFIIETNLFKFMPECPRVHDVIAFMAQRNFFLFDLAGYLRRPFENDLAQLDLVFVSAESHMVSSNKWTR